MKRLKKLIAIVLALLITLTFINTSAQTKNSFYPEITGWTKNKKVKTYSKNDLYDYIDGGATLYITNNFKKLFVMEYMNTKDESIVVEIYEHASVKDARTIYQTELTLPVDSIKVGLEGYKIGTSVLNFIQDNYYIKIFSQQQTENIESTILQIAKFIEKKL